HLPPGYNMLVCPVRLLKQHFDFVEGNRFRQRGRNDFEWVLGGTPFDCHVSKVGRTCDGRECWPMRLQMIRRIGLLGLLQPSPNSRTLSLEGDGALCFSKLRRASTTTN